MERLAKIAIMIVKLFDYYYVTSVDNHSVPSAQLSLGFKMNE